MDWKDLDISSRNRQREALGTISRYHRAKKGLTQQQLCELAGCTKGAVSQIEMGNSKPSYTLWKRMCRIFGQDAHYAAETYLGITHTEAYGDLQTK